MRKINPPKIDPYNFFCDIIESKHKHQNDPDYIDRIKVLKTSNKDRITEYNNAFRNLKIESITNNNHSKQERADYESLFTPKLASFKPLLQDIEKQNGGHEITICPICGNDRANTLDHFLPQSVFPEFSSHPLNLIPCCYVCNNNKSNKWHTTGDRICFNAYLDEEPNEQYLFCDITLINGIHHANFRIDGTLVTDKKLYTTIENTYNNLKLIDAYNNITNASDKSILNQLVKEFRLLKRTKIYSDTECKTLINNTLSSDPINNKERVFKIALLNDPSALNYIIAEVDKYL